MKVICDGLDLSNAVLNVSKALSVKSTNPVLEGIKICANGETLTLTATDLELTIEQKIKADVLMEGETVVVGKYFVDFVKKLEKEQVELARLYDDGLKIKYSDNESELQVFSAENFPKLEREEKQNFFEINAGDFKKIIDRTVIACSTDDSRPILKGCLFEIKDNLLTSVALDGFRMSVNKKEVKASNDFSAIIPSRTLSEIEHLISNKEENIKIYIEKNTLFAEIDNTTIYSRLIEGEFVKYNHILPTNFENVVTVNKEALRNSIDRASIVARNDKFNVIRFDIKENVMTVSSKAEIGNVNENVNINLKGKDILIAFNGKYIGDFIKICDEEFINMNLNSPIDPCIITSVNKNDFIYLILPLIINS